MAYDPKTVKKIGSDSSYKQKFESELDKKELGLVIANPNTDNARLIKITRIAQIGGSLGVLSGLAFSIYKKKGILSYVGFSLGFGIIGWIAFGQIGNIAIKK
jgi:hypothetical protein